MSIRVYCYWELQYAFCKDSPGLFVDENVSTLTIHAMVKEHILTFFLVLDPNILLQSRGMMSTMFVQMKQGVTVDDLRQHLVDRFSVDFHI